MDTRCVLSTLERLTHLHTRSDAHMSAVLQCVRVAVDNADESANTEWEKVATYEALEQSHGTREQQQKTSDVRREQTD